MRHFYALADSFLGANTAEYSHGFANTKIVYAFTQKSERDRWLKETKYLGAKALKRAEALKIGRGGREIYKCEWREWAWYADIIPFMGPFSY